MAPLGSMNLSRPTASPHSLCHVRCSRAVMPRRRDVRREAGSQDLSAFGSTSNRVRNHTSSCLFVSCGGGGVGGGGFDGGGALRTTVISAVTGSTARVVVSRRRRICGGGGGGGGGGRSMMATSARLWDDVLGLGNPFHRRRRASGGVSSSSSTSSSYDEEEDTTLTTIYGIPPQEEEEEEEEVQQQDDVSNQARHVANLRSTVYGVDVGTPNDDDVALKKARTLAERVAERMGNDSPSSSDNWHAKVAGTVDAVVSGNDASYASENTPPTTIKAAADAFNRQSASDQKRMADVVSDFGACIKVVGCGGGGSNAINDMMRNVGLDAAQFIAINTDAQALKINMAPTRLQVGERVTRGLGTGGDPELGELAAQESEALIAESLAGSDLTFIAAGMGGGTGSGSAPVVAKISRALGALTIGIVTTPFSFEGRRRTKQAEESIARLKEEVDALIIVPNDKLLSATEEDTSLQDAFRLSDSVLRQGVRGISEIITQAGLINVDFADVRSVMASAGNAMLGIGIATGKNRAAEAAREAVFSPLLDDGITCATGIVYNITGPPNLSLSEVNEASRAIAELADPEANIIFGACIDETMTEGQVQVTVVATGFYSDREAKNLPSGQVWNRDVEDFMGSTTNNNSVSVPSYLTRKKEAESRKRSGWWR